MSCSDCIKGVVHDGEPSGGFQTIGGVRTYVSLPPQGVAFDKTKAVLYCSDVFGYAIPNGKLLADAIASNGFAVYFPDYLNDDPIPANGLNDESFDKAGWFGRHGRDTWLEPLKKTIAGLKELGVKEFAITGYCFGGGAVTWALQENVCKVAHFAHPAQVTVPDDIEKIKAVGKAPFLISACETDQTFPIEAQEKTKEILGDGKYTPGFKMNFYKGVTHGVCVRGDPSVPEQKFAKENSFEEVVSWFQKYL